MYNNHTNLLQDKYIIIIFHIFASQLIKCIMGNALTRQISIDLITNDTNPIIEWFNELWSKLYVIETNVYHTNGKEFIYFINNGNKNQYVFYQDDENERFWCNTNRYWSILENKFRLNYYDTQMVTKILVENALNNSVTSPRIMESLLLIKVENALNNSVSLPTANGSSPLGKVGNALNNNVTSPSNYQPLIGKIVENALNNTVHNILNGIEDDK